MGTAVISSTLLSDQQEISTSVRYRLQHRVQVPGGGAGTQLSTATAHGPELWDEGCPVPRALTLTPVPGELFVLPGK